MTSAWGGFIAQGLVLGYLYAMPVGSLNVFIVHSALQRSFGQTMLTATVVALMDSTLAIGCFLGLGAIMSRFEWVRLILLSTGILFLLYSGTKLAFARYEPLQFSAENAVPKTKPKLSKTIASAFALTWLNPQGLIELSALFGGFRASMNASDGRGFLFGACIGGASWYFTISTLASVGKNWLTPPMLRAFNLICGLGLVFFGIKLAIDFSLSTSSSSANGIFIGG